MTIRLLVTQAVHTLTCGSGIKVESHPRKWTLTDREPPRRDGAAGSHTESLPYEGKACVARRWNFPKFGSRGRRSRWSMQPNPRVRTRRPDRRGQAPKGTGGMPRRHQMAGVEGRERSGGAAQRASIPEYPLDTRGTETSQYPQEQKSTETPSVAASERGPA